MSNDSEVTVEHDALVLGTVGVTFQRTLRTPESGLHDGAVTVAPGVW